MPLSEREQQILAEIEKDLRSEDDVLAPEQSPPPPRPAGNRLRLAAFIFILGLILLVAFFGTQNVPIGVLAFGAMVAAIVLAASSFSTLFESPEEGEQGTLGRVFSNWEERLRRRYRPR